MVSQEHIPESGLQSQSTHQTHLCSQSDSGGVGVEKKNRGFGSFGAPFEPQVSPQLSRNSCLLPEIYRRGGVITHQQKQEEENAKLPSSTSASAERERRSERASERDLTQRTRGPQRVHVCYTSSSSKSILGRMLRRHLEFCL